MSRIHRDPYKRYSTYILKILLNKDLTISFTFDIQHYLKKLYQEHRMDKKDILTS